MFRKLVSNLSFSPSVIDDIGRYSNKLKKEELTRRLSVLFIVLAVLVQSFALFSPPSSANASNSQDIIPGGVSSVDDFLSIYDRNDQDIKDIFYSLGIRRTDIAALRPSKIEPSQNTYALFRHGGLSSYNRESRLYYDRSVGGTGTRYFARLSDAGMENRSIDGWSGYSDSLGWFAVAKANGSIIVESLPIQIKDTSGSTQAVDRKLTVRKLGYDKTIENGPATNNDRIEYVLSTTNTRGIPITAVFDVQLNDALEYASLIDKGGGDFSNDTKKLSWQPVSLEAGETQSRTFVIKMFPQFPATSQGVSNPNSFDCTVTVVFGQKQSTPVDCPPEKNIEGFLMSLPGLHKNDAAVVTLVVLSLVLYFYLRTKIIGDELRILRHSFSRRTV